MIYEEKNHEPIRHILFHNQRNEKIEHVIVFLCGKGQRGKNLEDLFETGLPIVLRDNPGFELPNTVVMCCQLPTLGAWLWTDESLGAGLITYLRHRWANASYHLSGLSLGGQGALHIANLYGVNSVGVIAGFTWNKQEVIDSLHSIPTYFVHGENDTIVNDSARYVADTLIEKGEDCEYHLLDMGHNVWNWAYDIHNDKGYLAWFRRKFIETENPSESVPVQLDKLMEGDTVFDPNGIPHRVFYSAKGQIVVACQIISRLVNGDWKIKKS